jgi:hypothetical protein
LAPLSAPFTIVTGTTGGNRAMVTAKALGHGRSG